MSTGPNGLYVVEHQPPDAGAPIVVLVHGAMDRSTSFAKVARRLEDLRVVRYDRRGYGHSRPAGPGGIDEHLADLLAVIGERPCTLVGHSYGGTLSMLAAEKRPDLIRSLLVYEPPLPWIAAYLGASRGVTALADAATPEDAAEQFMRFMIGSDRWDRLPARTKAERRAEGPALAADVEALREGVELFEIEQLAVPMVVARGSEASPRHVAACEHLVAQVAGAEAAVIDGAAHGGHLSHPGPFSELVRRAVERAPQ